MEQQYKVVFRGTKKGGAEEERIKHKVSKLLRISHAECERLFNASDDVVMRRRVSLPEANKVQHLFARVGVFCEILPCEALALNQTTEEPPNLFKCNCCGYTKSLVETNPAKHSPKKCPNCNVITDQYKAYKQTLEEKKQIKKNLRKISKGGGNGTTTDIESTQKKSSVWTKITLFGLLSLLCALLLRHNGHF
ncbi:MAG: hypothetical protein ABW168_16525 [Sedimenticola sp.]